MISCTEFIPSYSELFTYLEDHYGREEVERFWTYLFKPTGKGIPLINYAREKGLRGCWEYWQGTLTEEAADCTKYMNEKKGWIYLDMRHCPSKGRLLELEKEIGLKPYHDYCGHCDYYRAALKEVGIEYLRCNIHTDEARCSDLLYDPKVFNGMVELGPDVEILDIRPDDHDYFHRDFHSSLNMGIDYMGREHGEAALEDFLKLYTQHVYKSTINAMDQDPLTAIEANIRNTYRLEKAEEVLHIVNDGTKLSVKIDYCPAVKHLHETGREVSQWFDRATSVVMKTLAEIGGLSFQMETYDHATGTAAYTFTK